MKEYKVVAYSGGMGAKKLVNNLQKELDNMASQGWRFIQKDGLLLIFERDI